MQKIALRISALDKKAEAATVRDLLELLNQYRPGPDVILSVEGDSDLYEIFMGPTFSGDMPDRQVVIKEIKQLITKEDA